MNILADVKRVEDTEANLLGGGIIKKQLGIANDTRKIIVRFNDDEYHAFSSDYEDREQEGKITVTKTTEQLRLQYNSDNYTTFTVNASGEMTINSSGDKVSFSDNVVLSSLAAATGIGDGYIVSDSGELKTRNAAGIADDVEGSIDHAELDNLNSSSYYHLTSANHTDLTDGGNTTLHIHDSRYYTEDEIDSLFSTAISGTENYLSKFSSGGASVEDSIIYDNGTQVAIGKASANHLLDVDGTAQVSTLLVGTSTTSSGEVVAHNATSSAVIEAWSTRDDEFSHAVFMGKAARGGAIGSESALQDEDVILSLAVLGYGDSDYDSSDRRAFVVSATQDWTDSAMGYGVGLYTRDNDTAAAPDLRFYVDHDGQVAIGTDDPDVLFEIFDDTASGGDVVPVLKLTRDDGNAYTNDDGLSIQFELPNAAGTEKLLGEQLFDWYTAGTGYSTYTLRLMSAGAQYNAMTYDTWGDGTRVLGIPADQTEIGRNGTSGNPSVLNPHVLMVSVEHAVNTYNWKNMLTLRVESTDEDNGDDGLGGGIRWELEDSYGNMHDAGRLICEWQSAAWEESYLRFYAYDEGEVEHVRIGYDQNSLQAGDVSGSDFVQVSSSGVMTFEGDAEFHPVRVSQNSEPTPSVGELMVWRDADDTNQVWLVYNDPDEGSKKVEMT